MNTAKSQPFPIADFVALCCGLLIFAAFALMPWILSFTGLDAISSISSSRESVNSSLWFVVVGGGISTLGAIFAVSSRSSAAWVELAGGVMSLLYFVNFFVQSNARQEQNIFRLDTMDFLGIGFWIAFIASAVLVLQILIPRPKSDPSMLTSQQEQ